MGDDWPGRKASGGLCRRTAGILPAVSGASCPRFDSAKAKHVPGLVPVRGRACPCRRRKVSSSQGAQGFVCFSGRSTRRRPEARTVR